MSTPERPTPGRPAAQGYRLPAEWLRRSAPVAGLLAYLREYRRERRGQDAISMLRLQECMPAGGCRVVYNFYDFDRVQVLGRARSLEVYLSHPPGEVQLIVGSRAGQMELRHLFHTSCLGGGTVLERVRRLASQVVRGAQQVADLDWLLDDERPRGARARRPAATAREHGEKAIHELFEEQAAQRPDAVALVAGEQRLTYGALNSYANRLALAR